MKCDYCRFDIPDDATVCGHCSRDLPPRPPEIFIPVTEEEWEEHNKIRRKWESIEEAGDVAMKIVLALIALPFVILFWMTFL